VLRGNIESGKMIFLARNTDRAFSAEKLAPPNPSCEVCGVARTSIEADLSEATLGDFVEKVLKQGLGYGEDISILTSQLLYDIDFDDNLEVPLKELGFGEETFVTIIDDDNEDGDPRVNLVITVTHNEELVDGPVTAPEKFEIPRRPKNVLAKANNGTKRTIEEVGESGLAPKKRKLGGELTIVEDRQYKARSVAPEEKAKDIIVLDDEGVIMLD